MVSLLFLFRHWDIHCFMLWHILREVLHQHLNPGLQYLLEEYFKYDIILSFPGYYLSWIGASVTVYLLSRLMNGQSKFDNILAVIRIWNWHCDMEFITS